MPLQARKSSAAVVYQSMVALNVDQRCIELGHGGACSLVMANLASQGAPGSLEAQKWDTATAEVCGCMSN